MQVHPTLPWFACNKKQRDGGGDWVREVKDDDEERRERKTVKEVKVVKEVNQGNNSNTTTERRPAFPVKTFGDVTDDRVVFLPSCFCVHKDVVGVI